MAVQTTYSVDHKAGFTGMVDGVDAQIESRFNEEAATEIPHGVMVADGTGELDAKLPAAAADVLAGVVALSHSISQNELGDTGIKSGGPLNVVRRGRVRVSVETAVALGDPVHVRIAGVGQKGAFRNAGVVAETLDISDFAQWRSTGVADDNAILEIDMTNENLKAAD